MTSKLFALTLVSVVSLSALLSPEVGHSQVLGADDSHVCESDLRTSDSTSGAPSNAPLYHLTILDMQSNSDRPVVLDGMATAWKPVVIEHPSQSRIKMGEGRPPIEGFIVKTTLHPQDDGTITIDYDVRNNVVVSELPTKMNCRNFKGVGSTKIGQPLIVTLHDNDGTNLKLSVNVRAL